METQYYTLIEKQDFFEIIENKYGELAIFIDARENSPENPTLEYDGKNCALLKRDQRLSVKLEGIDPETAEAISSAEFVMIVELDGKTVERVYAAVVENVEEIEIVGKQTRADEFIKAKSKDELLKAFGAIKSWKVGIEK